MTVDFAIAHTNLHVPLERFNAFAGDVRDQVSKGIDEEPFARKAIRTALWFGKLQVAPGIGNWAELVRIDSQTRVSGHRRQNVPSVKRRTHCVSPEFCLLDPDYFGRVADFS